MKVNVLLPSGASITVILQAHLTNGRFLLANVFSQCSIVGEDCLFFGLQYPDPEDGGMNWVEPEDKIKLHARKVVHFQLAVRFFPSCPVRALKDNKARCLFRQHVKGMLMNCELACETEQHARLDSYVLQAELGDYSGKQEFYGQSACTEIWAPTGLTVKTPISEKEYAQLVCLFYKQLVGMTRQEANIKFLGELKTLPSYGYNLHKVSDKNRNDLYIGLSEKGIIMFHGSLCNSFQIPSSHLVYKWSELNFRERECNRLQLGFFSKQHGKFEHIVKVPCKFTYKGAERLQKNILACRSIFLNQAGDGEVFHSYKSTQLGLSRIPALKNSLRRALKSVRKSVRKSFLIRRISRNKALY